MTETRFNIEDVVRISRKSECYNDNYSLKDIDGIIIKLDLDCSHNIRVLWYDEFISRYRDSDLALVRRSNG